ncbi:MAG: hypothetical protein ABII64_08000 [Elusimicrobiota bacterium]
MRRLILSLLLLPTTYLAVFAEWPKTPLPIEITTSPEDTEYLRGILKDTFRSIMYYRNPNTGLCTDRPENPDPRELQKAEHHFLMLTSIAIGGKIGLISEEQAAKEIDKTLSTMEKMKRNRGLYMSAYCPADGSFDKSYPEYSTADCGWIYCALITVGEAYPQFKKRTDRLVKDIDWSVVYKENRIYGLLKFGPDGSAKALYPIHDVQGDIRTFTFLIMALSGAPPELWANMEKHYIERYGVKYMKGGEAMGYGEQPMSMGYYLDERGSIYGMSCANLGWGQICYAEDMEFSSWGWSSCLDMDGYLGWGTDKRKIWSRINTHAVAAQVIYYPNQVVKAFKAMEKLGIRKPVTVESGEQVDFGLRDSIDVDTLEAPEHLLPGLDQNIVFLSLANYLYNGAVWKYFMRNKKIRRCVGSLDDYNNPKKEYLEIYKKRDLAGPKLPAKKTPRPKPLLVDDFSGDLNNLGGQRKESGSSLILKKGAAVISFDNLNERVSRVTEGLAGVDLTDYNALKLVMKGDEQCRIMVTMHLGGEGGYLPVHVTDEWSEIIIPFRSFMLGRDGFNFGSPNPRMDWTAMWHDRSEGQDIGIGPVTLKTVELKEISFLSLPKEKIREHALKLRAAQGIIIAKDGTLDSMDDPGQWSMMDDGSSKASAFADKGIKGNCIGYSFSIPAKGGWINLSRDANFPVSDATKIVFNMKSEGGPAHLQVKILDPSGATFMKVLKDEIDDSKWYGIEVECLELDYAWGGAKKESPEKASQIQLAITSDGSPDGVTGKVWFDELKIIQPK